MSSVPYQDGSTIKPTIVELRAWGEIPSVIFKEKFTGSVEISIGEAKSLVKAQDLLNAARLMGAKDIDVKIK